MTIYRSSDVPHTLFSRRARRARHAAHGLRNDWVWFLAYAIAAVVMIGGFFALSGAIGGSSTCAHPLAPLGEESPLSSQAFQDEDTALALVIERASVGDRAGAENAFYGEVHGFTHNVNRPLRDKDAALSAKSSATPSSTWKRRSPQRSPPLTSPPASPASARSCATLPLPSATTALPSAIRAP